MKLFNTASRSLEEFEPLAPPTVKIYTCGPTVYDFPHIGNWFTFLRYDILVRTLLDNGYRPEWVFNITDVGHLVSDADEGEDKLEKGARREGKSAQAIADYYTSYFLDGLKRLNFIKPNYLPRATGHIKDQIELIKSLEAKGYTYQIDDGIYFDTTKFPAYADFARLKVADQKAGARVNPNPQKRHPSDFALWKFSPPGNKRDMEWDSPWGKGFPGWHIECSALILKYLGTSIDIHAGGIDHIPVHHTNEIAQSEAATGQPLAQYWFHANHIQVDNQKISKSLGNGITLEEIEDRGHSFEALRLLVLQSHYRTQSNFSWDELKAAQSRLNSLRAASALRWQLKDGPKPANGTHNKTLAEIKAYFADDLSTPSALATLNNWSDRLNDQLANKADKNELDSFLGEIDKLTGLNLSKEPDISSAQKKLIADREAARAADDWQKADRLRDELSRQGLAVNDTKHGPVWYRA